MTGHHERGTLFRALTLGFLETVSGKFTYLEKNRCVRVQIFLNLKK